MGLAWPPATEARPLSVPASRTVTQTEISTSWRLGQNTNPHERCSGAGKHNHCVGSSSAGVTKARFMEGKQNLFDQMENETASRAAPVRGRDTPWGAWVA